MKTKQFIYVKKDEMEKLVDVIEPLIETATTISIFGDSELDDKTPEFELRVRKSGLAIFIYSQNKFKFDAGEYTVCFDGNKLFYYDIYSFDRYQIIDRNINNLIIDEVNNFISSYYR